MKAKTIYLPSTGPVGDGVKFDCLSDGVVGWGHLWATVKLNFPYCFNKCSKIARDTAFFFLLTNWHHFASGKLWVSVIDYYSWSASPAQCHLIDRQFHSEVAKAKGNCEREGKGKSKKKGKDNEKLKSEDK